MGSNAIDFETGSDANYMGSSPEDQRVIKQLRCSRLSLSIASWLDLGAVQLARWR